MATKSHRDEIARLIAFTVKVLRDWAAQQVVRRSVHLFAPANRFELLARGAVLRLAARPFLALLIKRLLNREGERL